MAELMKYNLASIGKITVDSETGLWKIKGNVPVDKLLEALAADEYDVSKIVTASESISRTLESGGILINGKLYWKGNLSTAFNFRFDQIHINKRFTTVPVKRLRPGDPLIRHILPRQYNDETKIKYLKGLLQSEESTYIHAIQPHTPVILSSLDPELVLNPHYAFEPIIPYIGHADMESVTTNFSMMSRSIRPADDPTRVVVNDEAIVYNTLCTIAAMQSKSQQ